MPIEQERDPREWYKLSAIVDDWLDDHDLHNFFPKALKWAIRGLEEVRLNHWQDVKRCLFDVGPRKTVELPNDFVDWVKVAVPYGQYAIAIGLNEDLQLTRRGDNPTVVNPLLSQTPPNGIDFNAYNGYYFFNYNGRQLFAAGPVINGKGHFRVHDNGTCKEMLLDYDYGCKQVYIEYITNGFDPCGESIVPPYLKQYLFAYLDEIYERRNNPKATEASRDRAARRLADAVVVVRAHRSNLTPQVMINLGRKDFRLTTKI